MINDFSSAGSAIALVIIALSIIIQKLPEKPKPIEKRAQEIIFEERAMIRASEILEKELTKYER